MPVVLASGVVGGWAAARQHPPRPILHGAVAAALALAIVQTVGVARRLAGDDPVAWAGVVALTALSVTLGAAGAAAGRGRPRP